MSPDQVIAIAGGVGLLLLLVLYLLNRRPTLDPKELQEDESPFAELMSKHRDDRDAVAVVSQPPPRPLRNPSDHFEAGWDAAVPSVPPPPGAPDPATLNLSDEPVAEVPTISTQAPTAGPGFLAVLRRELGRGKKISAIKELREASGLGLKECKDAIEHFERSGQLPPAVVAALQSNGENASLDDDARPEDDKLEMTDPEVAVRARRWLDAGEKIHAIKEVRTLTGSSLKAAKDFVERL